MILPFLPKKIWLKILYPHKLFFGCKLKISPSVKILLGRDNSKIRIDSLVQVRDITEIHADGGSIEIKNNVFINRNCTIVAHNSIVIGAYTSIGPNTIIYDHDHGIGGAPAISKPIKIGKNVWIAGGVTILKGVTIGDNSVIGAGTVVTHDVPANTVLYQQRTDKYRLINNNSN